jgi:hypothetical protein
LAQRLIRIVCEQCAENVRPPRALLDESGVSVVATATYNFRAGRGCLHCRGSGYRGRKAIGELLIMNDEIREAFVARVPVRQLKGNGGRERRPVHPGCGHGSGAHRGDHSRGGQSCHHYGVTKSVSTYPPGGSC